MLRYKQTVKCANAANILNIAEYRPEYLIVTIYLFHQENNNILQLLKNKKMVQHTLFNLQIFSAHFKVNILYGQIANMNLGHANFVNISFTAFYHNISSLNLERRSKKIIPKDT